MNDNSTYSNINSEVFDYLHAKSDGTRWRLILREQNKIVSFLLSLQGPPHEKGTILFCFRTMCVFDVLSSPVLPCSLIHFCPPFLCALSISSFSILSYLFVSLSIPFYLVHFFSLGTVSLSTTSCFEDTNIHVRHIHHYECDNDTTRHLWESQIRTIFRLQLHTLTSYYLYYLLSLPTLKRLRVWHIIIYNWRYSWPIDVYSKLWWNKPK